MSTEISVRLPNEEEAMNARQTIEALPPGELLTTTELAECCGVDPVVAHKAMQVARAFWLVRPAFALMEPGKRGPGTTVWRRL